VLVVELVGAWNVALVPALPVAGLVAAEQHDRVPARIECEQRAQMASERTDLFHVGMPRALDRGHDRATEARPLKLELVE
jgi:hypothetical protein